LYSDPHSIIDPLQELTASGHIDLISILLFILLIHKFRHFNSTYTQSVRPHIELRLFVNLIRLRLVVEFLGFFRMMLVMFEKGSLF
jgi:hypothetical protein